MKKILIFTFLCSFGFTLNSFAQKANKFGHINSGELLGMMPERKIAAARMDSATKEVTKALEEMMTEYRSKEEAYRTGASKMTDLVRADKEAELQNLATRIQNFQQTATQSLEQKEQELLDPIIQRAKKAIEQVAKENGYTYVFDTSVGALLFWEESDNILNLVKKKMNLP